MCVYIYMYVYFNRVGYFDRLAASMYVCIHMYICKCIYACVLLTSAERFQTLTGSLQEVLHAFLIDGHHDVVVDHSHYEGPTVIDA